MPPIVVITNEQTNGLSPLSTFVEHGVVIFDTTLWGQLPISSSLNLLPVPDASDSFGKPRAPVEAERRYVQDFYRR
jgi:hypothetical protein